MSGWRRWPVCRKSWKKRQARIAQLDSLKHRCDYPDDVDAEFDCDGGVAFGQCTVAKRLDTQHDAGAE